MAVSTSGWMGLGRTRDSIGDTSTREAGVTDRDAFDLLESAQAVTTANRARAMRALSTELGSQLPGAVRVKAYQGRQDALRHGIALPPWWRLRLAQRRTAAYQTAQDGPGSTPAAPT